MHETCSSDVGHKLKSSSWEAVLSCKAWPRAYMYRCIESGPTMNKIHCPFCLLLIVATIIGCVDRTSASHEEAAARLDPVERVGTIDSVTVYRGQALVKRRVDLGNAGGLQEFIVTDLPAYIVANSLHAEASDGVLIRSVRYRERPVRVDVRADIEALNQQLTALQDDLTRAERRGNTISQQVAYLNRLEQFAASGSMQDLSHGVLDAAALKELSTYLFEQRKELAEQALEISFTQRDLKKEMELVQREMNNLGVQSTRTAREAVILADVQQQGNAAIDLFYLVDRATWTPSYTVRGDLDQSQVTVEYFASIEQTSGEDWGNVNMTLSTATPSLVARAPVLTALPVQLQPLAAASPKPGNLGQLRMDQRGVERARASQAPAAVSGSRSDAMGYQYMDQQLNIIADRVQILEWTGGDQLFGAPVDSGEEGHSVTYQIAGRTTLPSRAGRQMIQIASTPLSGEFYKVAIPVLTTYVYEEATINNRTAHVLLAGPVSTYAGGQFVGHSSFDDTAIGEQMTIGLGINSLVRAERHVLNQDERIQGGNRVVDITYRLALQNFGDEATVIRLKDRLPQVQPSEIRLTILNDASAHDQVQQHKYDKTSGVLLWDVDVPAGATGANTTMIDYTVRLEYDRQMTISGM